MTRTPVDPVLKWVGSKRQLREALRDLLPQGARLVEPFVGSGAVFGALDYPSYFLADKNEDLILFHQMLMWQGERFIKLCAAYFRERTNTEDRYYKLREEFNTTRDAWDRAALFLYLNRHGFNGLWRVNNKGECNVPYGWHKRPPYFPRAELVAMQAYMQEKQPLFVAQGFEATLAQCRPGDVVYMDPPYAPASATANFAKYTVDGFDNGCQARLVEWSVKLRNAGVWVAISNSDTPYTRSLYSEATEIVAVLVQRSVAANGSRRGKAPEVIAVYAPR